jgi:hypothetical protein
MADNIRATPRNELLGLLSDAMYGGLDYMKDPRRTQQLQGLAGLLESTGIPKTTQRMAYGEPLTNIGRANVPLLKPETAEAMMAVAPFAPVAGKTAKGIARMYGSEINAAMMGERGGLLGAMTPQPMNIVPPSVVRQINMPVNLPKSKEFLNAVTQEPSAAITPEGLLMNVKRQQVPEQSGMESVRTGVFYLPESQSSSVYKGKQGYGGSEPIQGSTLYKNPLFVKGATGGKAPESAYDQLLGKGSYQTMRNEALDVASGYRTTDFERVEKARAFLEKYGGDPDLAEYIVQNSKYGNQLTYALQENAVANAVRNAGHDAVLGYSKGRGDKGEFFSEVFDVREQSYPTPQGDYQLMPQFESLLK